MATVQTVKGPVDTSALGHVLMHEHVFVLSPEIDQNYPAFDEEAEVKNAIVRLNELKAAGIDTIVDLTVVGLGRYIPRIERINAEANINIVAATGLYTYDHVPHYFHFRGPGTLVQRSRSHGRDVRRGHREGHRRHQREGRHPEVRDRRAGRHRRSRAGAASRGADPPRDRCARSRPTPRSARDGASSSRTCSTARAST